MSNKPTLIEYMNEHSDASDQFKQLFVKLYKNRNCLYDLKEITELVGISYSDNKHLFQNVKKLIGNGYLSS